MCTVTIVPHDYGFRLVCNRDERRDRPAALPPTRRACGHRIAAFPVDPTSGGAWVGVNDAGLVASLLNRTMNARVPRVEARHSRGLIVPRLMASQSWDEAMVVAAAVDPTSYAPFRLVVARGSMVGEIFSDGRRLSSEVSALTTPRLFTSSSLGDALVHVLRGGLFEQLVIADRGSRLRGQFRFHRHRWPHLAELSVEMSRADAATVSRTVIDVSADEIRLSYAPLSSETIPAVRVA